MRPELLEPRWGYTAEAAGVTIAACDVQIIEERRPCAELPAWPFTAVCACGHEISGTACDPCMVAVTPGCLACWDGGKGHRCPVTFRPGVCRCGCGTETAIARKSDSRYGRKKGRPVRFVPGHNLDGSWI